MARQSLLQAKIDRWDSSFFNTTIARMILSGKKNYSHFAEKMSNGCLHAVRSGADFLVVKLEDPILCYVKAIRSLKFRKYSESIDFILRFPKKLPIITPKGISVGLFRKRDKDPIERIAATAFRRSYLYKCGFARQGVIDRYHATWVGNLAKDKNTVTFVVRKKGLAIGFINMKADLKEKYDRVILIAVDKKYRGRGIGAMLMKKCIDWAANNRCEEIYVKTQADNSAAIATYKKFGFSEFKCDMVFCKKLI